MTSHVRTLISSAKELCEGTDNLEYVRGQAELIAQVMPYAYDVSVYHQNIETIAKVIQGKDYPAILVDYTLCFPDGESSGSTILPRKALEVGVTQWMLDNMGFETEWTLDNVTSI